MMHEQPKTKPDPDVLTRLDAPVNRGLDHFASLVQVLQPGLVLIKQGLSPSAQIDLTRIALDIGSNPERGFWNLEGNVRVLNQTPNRGRVYDALGNVPPLVSELVRTNLLRAHGADPSISVVDMTHMLLLYYQLQEVAPTKGYIAWHQDVDPNDGDAEIPVISFTLGESCDFLVCNQKPSISVGGSLAAPKNLDHRVLLESGDVLIFGGASRYIHHAIYAMHPKTGPEFLPEVANVRLNFTFRYAPGLLGKEEEFSSKNFRSVYGRPNP